VRLLQRFAEDVAEFGVVEFTPMIDGRNMVMIIAPLKSKAEAKAEAVKTSKKTQVSEPAEEEKPAEKPAAKTTTQKEENNA
jgi:translation initiation factor IF-3